MTDTLIALSQRTEAFWIGLGLLALGVLTPGTLSLWGVGLSRSLIFLGGGMLLVRLAVGLGLFLKTTVEAGVGGYRDGKEDSN